MPILANYFNRTSLTLLFFFICVPTRFLIAYLCYYNIIPIQLITFISFISMLRNYKNMYVNNVNIWWNNRFHLFISTIIVILSLFKNYHAIGYVICVDILFGILSYIHTFDIY